MCVCICVQLKIITTIFRHIFCSCSNQNNVERNNNYNIMTQIMFVRVQLNDTSVCCSCWIQNNRDNFFDTWVCPSCSIRKKKHWKNNDDNIVSHKFVVHVHINSTTMNMSIIIRIQQWRMLLIFRHISLVVHVQHNFSIDKNNYLTYEFGRSCST